MFIVRIAGRRPGTQMTPFEYVLIFFVGGIPLTGMVADESMTNSPCAVMAVGMMHRLFSILTSHFQKFGALIDGTPVVLMNDGKFQSDAMKNSNIDPAGVMAAPRAKGVKTLKDIRHAVLERSGSISIIKSQS